MRGRNAIPPVAQARQDMNRDGKLGINRGHIVIIKVTELKRKP
jgi:hypothetical protein